MSGRVRAKMVCTNILEKGTAHWKDFNVDFSPVVGDSAENEKYFKATPSGGLSLGGLNSRHGYEVGKEYYVDTSPAPEEVPPTEG